MSQIPIAQRRGLWIAFPLTRYGHMELLCGDGEAADLQVLCLVEAFLEAPTDHLGAIRRAAFRLPWLWHPIRFAVNNQGRLGVQFRQRLSGKQEGMFFADEYSSFGTLLSQVVVSPEDASRLKGRLTSGAVS